MFIHYSGLPNVWPAGPPRALGTALRVGAKTTVGALWNSRFFKHMDVATEPCDMGENRRQPKALYLQ